MHLQGLTVKLQTFNCILGPNVVYWNIFGTSSSLILLVTLHIVSKNEQNCLARPSCHGDRFHVWRWAGTFYKGLYSPYLSRRASIAYVVQTSSKTISDKQPTTVPYPSQSWLYHTLHFFRIQLSRQLLTHLLCISHLSSFNLFRSATFHFLVRAK